LYTSSTLHIPAAYLPGSISSRPKRLTTILFLRYCLGASHPVIEPISKAEGGVRLFANALNPLAHAGDGIDGAIEIARRCSCFELRSAHLPSTCELVRGVMEN
jgi:hypothetical protein